MDQLDLDEFELDQLDLDEFELDQLDLDEFEPGPVRPGSVRPMSFLMTSCRLLPIPMLSCLSIQFSWMPGGGIDSSDNLHGEKTRPGECYQGFACVGLGLASVNVSVNRVAVHTLRSYAPMILKQILRSRGLKTTGDKEELIQRIEHYMQARVGVHGRARSRSRSR